MYFSLLVRLTAVLCFLSCTACSALFGDHGVFRGKQKDYLLTDSIKQIELPEDMESRSIVTLYEVPNVEPRDEFGDVITLVEYDIPRPVPINTEKGKTGVKIQKIGDKRWIFINASTSQVWPRTQNYLSTYGFPVVDSDPAVGLIETGDVVYDDHEERKSRFRIFIEKGVHPETTEIHVVQTDFAADETAPSVVNWPSTSKNTDIEGKLINSLANTLAQSVNNNSASLLGQNVGGSLKVEFLKNQAEPTMRIRLYEKRALATLAHALDREGFVVWDQLREQGIFYVGFDSRSGKGASFWRMFGDSFPDEAPYQMTDLLSHLSPEAEVKERFAEYQGVSFGDPLDKKFGFLVLLDSSEQQSDVVIRDMSGERLPRNQAKTLLRIIRKNLI